MKVDVKNALKKTMGQSSSDELEMFFQLLEMPNKKFDNVYPQLRDNFEQTYKTDFVRKSMKKELESMPMIDLESEYEGIKNLLKDINEDPTLSTNKKELLSMLFTNTMDVLTKLVDNPRDIIPVKIVRISEDAVLPTYAHNSDAGADVYSIENVELKPHKTEIIKTGLKVAIPKGYEIQIRPRSGVSLKTTLRIANSPATIDSSYRGEIGIIMENTGNLTVKIEKGERIAQMLIAPTPMIQWEEVNELDSTERGAGGYGSTGKR